MDIVMFLSYIAVYFLGIASTVIALIILVQRFERETERRKQSSNEAAGRLKEHLDHMPTPGPILIDRKVGPNPFTE